MTASHLLHSIKILPNVAVINTLYITLEQSNSINTILLFSVHIMLILGNIFIWYTVHSWTIPTQEIKTQEEERGWAI